MTPQQIVDFASALDFSLSWSRRALLVELGALESAEIARQRAEIARLRAENAAQFDVLRRNGFRPCDVPACNCRSWHMVGGLRERMDEIKSALADAGHPLSNDNGNLPLNALSALVAERDALRALTSTLRAELQSTKDALRAEVERMRAEVDRYQAVKSLATFEAAYAQGTGGWWRVACWSGLDPALNTFDAAIDAARAA